MPLAPSAAFDEPAKSQCSGSNTIRLASSKPVCKVIQFFLPRSAGQLKCNRASVSRFLDCHKFEDERLEPRIALGTEELDPCSSVDESHSSDRSVRHSNSSLEVR